jgi:hypothetical protein
MEFSAPPANEFHTAEGIDALKQQLGDIREATQPAADRATKRCGGSSLTRPPAYAGVMKGYEEASDLIREIETTLSTNPRASVDTTLRKLTSALRNSVSNYGRPAELVGFGERRISWRCLSGWCCDTVATQKGWTAFPGWPVR